MLVQDFVNFRGALTSKPYAFLARPWEFKSVDSVDVFDALGSNIRIDVRGDRVLRILPRSNDAINEDWISDRVRFVCDAIRLQRLDVPLLRSERSYTQLSWYQTFLFLASLFFEFSKVGTKQAKTLVQFYNCFMPSLVNSNFLGFNNYIGRFLDLESGAFLNKIHSIFRPSLLTPSSLLKISEVDDRHKFLLNLNLSSLANFKTIVLVGFNLKLHGPLIGVRLRRLIKQGVVVYNFGTVNNFSSVLEVGTLNDFNTLLRGQHWLSGKILRSETFFLVGSAFDGRSVLMSLFNRYGLNGGFFEESVGVLNSKEFGLLEETDSFSVQTNLATVQAFQTNTTLNFANRSLKTLGFNSSDSPFRLFLASHGGLLAQDADFVLPISTFFEQSKAYLNVLGVKQHTRLSLVSPKNVLDHSESLLLLIGALYINQLSGGLGEGRLHQLFGYLNSGALLFSNVWVYINRFFESVGHNIIIFSALLRLLLDSDFFAFKKIITTPAAGTFVTSFPLVSKKVNSVSSKPSFSDSDVYLQDEISVSSTTLTAASKRLNVRSSFF